MIRVKLPFGGVTPEQMEAFADVVEKYVPLRKGHITTRQNIQMHHVPLPDAEKLIRETRRTGPVEPRGLRQHDAQRHRRPVGGRRRGRAVRPDPLRRRLRALLRAPPDDARRCRARSRRRSTAARRGPRDHAASTTSRFRARVREIDGREVRGVEMLVGGGTSIMPRVAPDALRLRRARRRRVPEGAPRPCCGSSTARSGCASTAPAPASRCSSTSTASTSCASRSRRSCRATGSPNATSRSSTAAVRRRRARVGARRRRTSYGSAQRRPLASSSASAPPTSRAQKQEGFVTVEVQDHARRPHARAVPRPRADHARATPAATRARPCSRTSCCAGCARSRVYEVWRALVGARPRRRRARARSTTSSPARAPTAASSGSPARWGSTQAVQERIEAMAIERPADARRSTSRSAAARTAAASTTSPTSASRARRSRSASTRSPPTSRTSAGVFEGGEVAFGTRLKLRLPAKRVPEAVERWIRHYEARPRGRRGVERVRRARRARASSRSTSRSSRCPSTSRLETMNQFIDWNRDVPVRSDPRRGRVRGLEQRLAEASETGHDTRRRHRHRQSTDRASTPR